MNELRQFERFILDAPAKLYLQKDQFTRSTMIRSVAHDISSGGAFLNVTDSRLPENSDVIVEIILTIDALNKIYGYSNEVKLTSKAHIIRTSQEGVGVSFTGKPVMVSNIN